MRIDARTFAAIAAPLFPQQEPILSPIEARAITQLCLLASNAELDDDPEERELAEQIGRHVCAIAGITFESVPWPTPLPLPRDDEARRRWIARLCRWLVTPSARELAYVLTYLLSVGDLALAPIETVFMSELQDMLDITDERAAHLVARAAECVTPLVEARPA